MFDCLEYMTKHDHEQVLLCHDRATELRAIIGVHNTTLGPGLGGIRLWRYDCCDSAILDVLRLSEGMTFKAAVAELPLGGGKAVVLADGRESDPGLRADRFRALGRFIEGLGGQYIAAEDVGTTPSDMMAVRSETSHVVGLPLEAGGSGDPSPVTALGVLYGMQALVEEVMGVRNFRGLHVAIQGLGKVGMTLAEHLIEKDAFVTGCDVNPERETIAGGLGVRLVAPERIYAVPCDIFSPCALGAVLNDLTIPELRCRIVAGAANNQLAEDRHVFALQRKGIVYGVDYVINAGGLINVAHEVNRPYDHASALQMTGRIYNTTKRMLESAQREGITTVEAARRIALERLEHESLSAHRDLTH